MICGQRRSALARIRPYGTMPLDPCESVIDTSYLPVDNGRHWAHLAVRQNSLDLDPADLLPPKQRVVVIGPGPVAEVVRCDVLWRVRWCWRYAFELVVVASALVAHLENHDAGGVDRHVRELGDGPTRVVRLSWYVVDDRAVWSVSSRSLRPGRFELLQLLLTRGGHSLSAMPGAPGQFGRSVVAFGRETMLKPATRLTLRGVELGLGDLPNQHSADRASLLLKGGAR